MKCDPPVIFRTKHDKPHVLKRVESVTIKLPPEAGKKVVEILCEHGIMAQDYAGQVVLNCGQGSATTATITE